MTFYTALCLSPQVIEIPSQKRVESIFSGLITKIPGLKRRPVEKPPGLNEKVRGLKRRLSTLEDLWTTENEDPWTKTWDWISMHVGSVSSNDRHSFMLGSVTQTLSRIRTLTWTPQQISRMHDNEKKPLYSRRVLGIKYGTFRPLVFTTTGVMGKKCLRYHKLILSWVPASWKGSNMPKLCHGSEAELIKRSSAWH